MPIHNITNVSTMLSKIDEIGGPLSYPTYPLGWAMADNTPNKLYKWTSHEGGTHDAMIIYWPDGIKDGGDIRSQFCHVIDIVPTVLEVLNSMLLRFIVVSPRSLSKELAWPIHSLTPRSLPTRRSSTSR